MENVNGGLAFRATLDIDDFNVSAEAMERHVRQMSQTAVSEAAQMDQSLLNFAQNGARYIVSYLVGQGMTSLLNSAVQVRGTFQQLEIAFGTMLKSDLKAAELMNELIMVSAKTPFDLQGIAASAKQMMAYGSSAESVVDELVMLGNIASGVGAPLNEIAYLYGTLRTQGRAYTMDIRQFAGRGIPIYEELAKVLNTTKDNVSSLVSEGKVGFADVEKAFRNLTSSSGMYYNLMEKQSKSLTGQLSNLGDAWDNVLNKIGEQHQDTISVGISGVINLVEHYDDILRIIKSVAIAYGTYKAAIVLNTLVTKGYTGVALIDNTVRQAKLSLLKLDEIATGKLAMQTQRMAAAEQANTVALQQQLTVEEHANLVKRLRISTIQSLLTAQQQEYLSNLNLSASSANYEAVAMGVLTVEQREALSKTDLSAKSAVYRAALAQEVASKVQNKAATLDVMRTNVKAAAQKLESAKQSAVASMQSVEAARYELYWAKQSGDATRIATAEKKLEGAVENQSMTRKAALAAQTDFLTQKKNLETAAVRRSTVATQQDTGAKNANTISTSLLTTMTTKATLAIRTMWAAMKANPIGWIIGLVGALVSVFSLFRSKEEEAVDTMGEFNSATRKEIDNLETLFAILRNTEKGTKTHKVAIEKVNDICQEYNKTLLDENAALGQQKSKYDELKLAIQETTAEKIKAKYVEQAMQEAQNDKTDALDELKSSASSADYYAGQTQGIHGNVAVYNESKHIQQATGAVWEAIEAEAIQAAENLKTLTGSAYTDSYNEALSRIMSMLQESTGAADVEMQSFSAHLNNYLTAIVQTAQKTETKIAQVDKELKAFLKTPSSSPKKTSVDYMSLSFEELDKKVKETQQQLDELNKKDVKLDTDNDKIKELLVTLGQIKTAIDTKTDNLNTESSISARVKQLKEERSNVEINSKKYNDLSLQITKLEERLPKSSSSGSRSDLNTRELEAAIKLEEDRISVMEDGYEKRKAILDLQHKKNLLDIDKEEKELLEARKKAGKGGLTASQKEGFKERRKLEKDSYSKDSVKLFDEEIKYRKEQYKLYGRWVQAMGAETANKQFAHLLKSGTSYSQWIDQEIAKLSAKKAENPESFSSGDEENLYSLTVQRDEINGVKSSMDRFNESISEAINQAANLAEKIEIIAKYKKELEDGKFKLTEDETLEASNTLDTMDRDSQQELNQMILNDFKTYEEKKRDIEANFAAMRLTTIAQNNADIMEKIKQGEADTLSSLEAERLQTSTDWQNLFTNLDTLTADEIQKLISTIEGQMASTNLKLSPVDYRAVIDSLNQAKERIVTLNPFKALGSSFKTYISELKKLKRAQKQNLSDAEIQKYKVGVVSAAQQVTASIGQITQTTDSIGGTIAGVADSFGADGRTSAIIEGVTGALAGAGKAAGGVGKIMSGDLMGGITDVISGIGDFIISLNGMSDALREENIKDLQKEIDTLAQEYDILGESIDKAYSTDKADLLRKQNENLRKQNEKIKQQMAEEEAKKKTDASKIDEWQNQIAENEKEIIENEKYNIIEAISGTDIMSAIDDFASAYADAWSSGETAAKKSGETVKNIIRKAIIEQLKDRLQPEVTKFMSSLADAMEDGVVSEAEERLLEQMQSDMDDISDRYLSQNSKWLKDDEDSSKSKDALIGAAQNLKEETGGIIAGRMNAIVINQSEQLVILRNHMIYQAEIATNTRMSAERLSGIEDTLKRIENKGNSLLSQGIS